VKNILVLSNEKQWKMGFANALKLQFQNNEIQAQYVVSRTEAINEISQTQYDLFLISKTFLKKEIEMLFRYISTNDSAKMNIFFISEDFEQFSEVLKIYQFPKIHLFSYPIEHVELSKQLRMTLIPVSRPSSAEKNLKINLEFLKTFVDSTKFIFQEFCLLKEIQHQKPYLVSGKNEKAYDLEGHIKLQSDLFNGIFYVCFSTETYLKIVKHVLMEEAETINPTNIDFVAEIVNMIYGQAKIALNQAGHNFKKVIPEFTLNPPKIHSTNFVTVVPIDTEIGTIDIKIELIKSS
jgi:CheY-specific phosphatase CheX